MKIVQTVCINDAISNITFNTTGATGIGTPTNLPTGVTAAWSSNVLTISGTPTVAGTFAYSVPLTGGCGSVAATGTITVNDVITAATPSTDPTLCVNTALTDITIATTGATGIGTATDLPAGVTASWASDVITITGTPTAIGTYNYSIPLTGGCGTVNATGTITVNDVSASSETQTACDSLVWNGTTYTTSGTYTYTTTNMSGCDSVVTLTLTITPSDDATFAYGSSSYCSSATDPTPTVSGVSGGAFSSTTGLVINSSTGAIDLDASTAGTYVVTYSTASTEQTISTSNLFAAGPNATWTHVYTTALTTDGASSQSQQTMNINITNIHRLP